MSKTQITQIRVISESRVLDDRFLYGYKDAIEYINTVVTNSLWKKYNDIRVEIRRCSTLVNVVVKK